MLIGLLGIGVVAGAFTVLGLWVAGATVAEVILGSLLFAYLTAGWLLLTSDSLADYLSGAVPRPPN